MEIFDIVNSSKKKVGVVEVSQEGIVILHDKKPPLRIADEQITTDVHRKTADPNIVIRLFDELTLLVGEVAALYERPYGWANLLFKTLPLKSKKKSGRRNSSFGKKFSQERIRRMVEGRSDDHRQLAGVPKSKDVKEKISKTLKRKILSGEVESSPERLARLSKEGNLPFQRAITGTCITPRGGKVYFRSLLELAVLLKFEEEGVSYTYEPFIIPWSGGTCTPDFLVGSTVYEVKSYKYIVERAADEEKRRFKEKNRATHSFCQLRGLRFKILWDKDVPFDTSSFKRRLRANPELLEKYYIEFSQPERVLSQK